MRNKYITYIVAMQPYLSRLQMTALCSYFYEKQRQHRRDDARPTETGNTRREQLVLMMPTESLTNREWLPALEWITVSKAR